MSFTWKVLAGFLLIFIFSTKGAAPKHIPVQGALDHDFDLSVPGYQMNKSINHIQWNKNGTRIIQYQNSKVRDKKKESYELFPNGTLKIKHLDRSDEGTYKVIMYNEDGKNVLEKTFVLRILEKVSKPVIFWSCINRTLTCEVTKGTDFKLRLYHNGRNVREGQTVVTYRWDAKPNGPFTCVANNSVSEETSKAVVECPGEGLDNILILSICGGGLTFLIFVALLIVYISKRNKQHRGRSDEELEVRAHRKTSEEGGRKFHQVPGSAPQNPAASQPPPPPGHRPQVSGHRPPPSGHRVQQQHKNQKQRRPLPSPGTQVHQQKGPPLPRPRVQPKFPRGVTENS
ncbi:T-cell surface antigen CD2 [Rousettus aegyptiacus]|uniref:T-cell surface antigen CD2 n=1 Tax=Rousettus aegyptiacus TaxID=9407 RepID=A0A7J8BCD7_ROUAE|nr:T-cell surface antigen CD2 [Rousettus aegyptiacus]KAF6396332.1 CD2 molecule [Rousettus aegyptiacus]